MRAVKLAMVFCAVVLAMLMPSLAKAGDCRRVEQVVVQQVQAPAYVQAVQVQKVQAVQVQPVYVQRQFVQAHQNVQFVQQPVYSQQFVQSRQGFSGGRQRLGAGGGGALGRLLPIGLAVGGAVVGGPLGAGLGAAVGGILSGR